MIYLGAVICVFGIACGQILFKLCADSYRQYQTVFNSTTLTLLFSSLTLYGVMTLLWIWLLGKTELNRLYPFMALAFVTVPVLSYFFLGECITTRYFIGVCLIIIGICTTLWQKQ